MLSIWSITPNILWFPPTNNEEGARQWNNPSKIQSDEALPEAVLTEGMPAGELDRTGPLAQAYAALGCACVHLHRLDGQASADVILPLTPFPYKSGGPDVSDGVLSASPVRRRAPDGDTEALSVQSVLPPAPPSSLALQPSLSMPSLCELVNRGF